jgi:hypothetical protein
MTIALTWSSASAAEKFRANFSADVPPEISDIRFMRLAMTPRSGRMATAP